MYGWKEGRKPIDFKGWKNLETKSSSGCLMYLDVCTLQTHTRGTMLSTAKTSSAHL